MKKLILIPALLLGTISMASEYNYEITPVIGYNIAEGNLNLDNEIITGVQAKFNNVDSLLKPELSLLHSGGVKSENTLPTNTTNITRVALNGVYEYPEVDNVIPFAKAGVGYEHMNREIANNSDGAFVDAGAGVKIPFSDELALKFEALYMLKYNDNSAGGNWGDSNLALLAGLNYSFGKKAQPEPTPEPMPEPEPTPEPMPEPAPEPVVVDGDDDNDGVLNSMDECPNTPENAITVDAVGCEETLDLRVKFEFDSYKVTNDSLEEIKEFGSYMNERKTYKARIVGHTDSSGSEAYNQKLSEERAKAVADLIVSEGEVSADRLTTIGKGETEPKVANDTKENRAKNRRTVVELSKD